MSAASGLWTLAVIGAGLVPLDARDGVSVFLDASAPVLTLEAEGVIEAPPAMVRDVLVDYANYPRMVERVAESRVLTSGHDELYVYQRLKLPVVSDRDYTLHVRWREPRPATLEVVFAIDNAHGPGDRPQTVRMTSMTGQWHLTPISGGRATLAHYRVAVDFALVVPQGMLRDESAKDLHALFRGVRRLSEERLGHRGG